MSEYITNSVADDFSFIANRLKEIKKERDAALQHDPDAPPPVPKAPPPTSYDDYYCG